MTDCEEGLEIIEFAALQAARDDLNKEEVEAIYQGLQDGLSEKPRSPLWQQVRTIIDLIFTD